jgi:hypothetical protein
MAVHGLAPFWGRGGKFSALPAIMAALFAKVKGTIDRELSIAVKIPCISINSLIETLKAIEWYS